MTAIAAERYTGASIKRSEDPRILTGAGRYVDDIKLPGMLHAAFVRSPMAHARVLSVDVSAARALPGVVAVLTGADLEAMTVPGPDALMALMGWAGPTPEFTLLATDKVRLVGDPVAVVIAESRYLAEDGCELVEVEYDDLPPVVSAAFALDPGSPPLFANLGDNIARPRSRNEFGDVSGTFAGADRVIDFHIDVHRHQNVPDGGTRLRRQLRRRPGVMTMYAATQSVHVTKIAVAMRLGLEQDKVRVLAGDIGGSFGLKIGASREELAVAAALASPRPAGQVGRGPRREPHRVRAGARGKLRRPGRGQRRRRPARAGREDGHRHRRVPGHGRDGSGHHRGDAARSVQARGPGLRVDRGRSRTRRPTSPTAGRGRPRRSCGNASWTSSRRTSAWIRSRSGCVTSPRAPTRRP